MSHDILFSVMNSTTLNGESVNLEMQRSKTCDKCFDLDAELLKTQNSYNDLLKSYSQLKQHYISLELSIQLNQKKIQKDKLCDNQNALEIPDYFENNNLKAQLQAKDTTICKLKEHIKYMRENDKEKKVKHDMDEIETINIELEHSVAKLLSENEHLHKEIDHLKQIYKDRFDSIKRTRVRTKEHSDSLILQLNSKSVDNADLKAQIQDKVFVIISLKNDLQKLKGKEIVENVAQIPIATTIDPSMFKLDLDPLAPRLLKNKEAHIDYLKHTQEQADILQGIVEQAKAKQPLDNALDFAFKRVRFSEPLTSSSSIKQGLGHNLFSVGQFCDADLEVAFWKNTCFIRNLEGVDLLPGSRDTNLYTISLDDMLRTSLICLLSKASKTKSWLWHRRLSHLNFGSRSNELRLLRF
ncbi:hypothetical protein Tco_0413429 [Tanacetum coccineum]